MLNTGFLQIGLCLKNVINSQTFAFVFSDGNIGSEDSSLSDALVLEDGRWLRGLGRGLD